MNPSMNSSQLNFPVHKAPFLPQTDQIVSQLNSVRLWHALSIWNKKHHFLVKKIILR